MDWTSAPCAATGRLPFGILPPLGLLALFAAGRAGGSPFHGRALAAANAKPGLDPRFLAPLALGAGVFSLHVRVRSAIGQPGSLACRVFRAVRGPALLEARLARRVPLRGGGLAAPGANVLGVARGPLLARPLALVFGCPERIAPRFSLGAQPGVALPAGGVSLRRAGLAHRTLRGGRASAASGT